MFDNHKNRFTFLVSIHLFIWLFLLMLPYLLSTGESFDLIRLVKFTWVPLLFSAFIFYNNYFLLIDRLLLKKKILGFVIINLACILLFVWIQTELREFLNMISETKPSVMLVMPKPPPIQLLIYKGIISLLIPIVIAIAVKAVETWAKSQTEKKEHERDLLRSELLHLKYQLQPHFFFNSLNTIYALIERSPDKAQETVHGLSKLMRYMLYETNNPTAQLKDEVEFMKEYVQLMKLRTSEKTEVSGNFTAINQNIEIGPLLFISLIENAFKHGISATLPSKIVFDLQVTGNKIVFITTNTNFPKTENDKSGSGIGLINLRKRLELLYPHKHKFETSLKDNTFTAILEITHL